MGFFRGEFHPMAKAFIHHRTAEFADTDMAGLVHFSNIFRYAESAETALFSHLGHPILEDDGQYERGWPRVRASARFHHPILFGDRMEIRLELQEIKIRALCWKARLLVRDSLAATVEWTTCHVSRPRGAPGKMEARGIPPALLDKLSAYAERLET